MLQLRHVLDSWSRACLGGALAMLAIGMLGAGCGSAEQSATAPSGTASGPAAAAPAPATAGAATAPVAATGTLTLTDAQWKARLTPEVYQVLRHQETEPAFCGGYKKIEENGPGTYCCAGCGAPLFTADTKFHSGTGWPSFFQAIPGAVGETHDTSYGMDRTEIHCARCGGHLGHVFTDGPAPTGLRYCINAAALTFTPTGRALPPLVLAPAEPAAPTPSPAPTATAK
jgi:peptide-methionine (R)-S-oxide reductase